MKVTDTLSGINLNIRISFTMPDVLRVQTDHHMGQLLRTPSFDLKLDDPQKLQVDDSEESVTIKTENTAGKPYTVRLVNVQAASVTSASMVIDGKDTMLTPSESTVSVTL